MWGKGAYFAKDAKYSHAYGYKTGKCVYNPITIT